MSSVRSSSTSNTYGWMRGLSGLREWLRPRTIDNLVENAHVIFNRHFEKTVAVNRNSIEDDNIGIYATDFAMMGDATARLPEELVWGLLAAGFTLNGFDGVPFFSTTHPVVLADGTSGTYANTDGGGGVRWYLFCDDRPLRPLVQQERKAPVFAAQDDVRYDNVFDRNEFVYGVDMRCNVGFGMPQLAWGSRQTRNAANYAIARAAISGFRADGGAPLGLVPRLLVVPPSQESATRTLLNSEYGTGGVTNEWKGTAEVLVVPWLS